jgi:hypothetical protein
VVNAAVISTRATYGSTATSGEGVSRDSRNARDANDNGSDKRDNGSTCHDCFPFLPLLNNKAHFVAVTFDLDQSSAGRAFQMASSRAPNVGIRAGKSVSV